MQTGVSSPLGLLTIAAALAIGLGIHWRRLRRFVLGLFGLGPAAWHWLTEHRFRRVVASPEAAEALRQLRRDKSLDFSVRLARIDDLSGGFSGAAEMLKASIRKERFCIWELERYCAAIETSPFGRPSERIAERYAALLPPVRAAKEEAERQVAHLLANKRAVSSQDYMTKQLWLAAVSALASALAALMALATVLLADAK